jgi:hypothetical protein
MIRKKIAIAIILVTIICVTGILVPTMLLAANSDSPIVTRLYASELAGPWSSTASITTRWVQKNTMVNGQTIIVIQEVSFMREEATGALVFFGGTKGETGLQGPQGAAGSQGAAGQQVQR